MSEQDMKRVLAGAAVLLAAVFCLPGRAADDRGRSVVLLVNAASEDSEAVAAHYARLRGVPAGNVCRVRCTTSEVISRRRFESQIREPLRRFLLEKGLATKRPDGGLALRVRYLVSTYGVPVKIREDYRDADLADVPRPPHRQTAAAVDSELSLIAFAPYSRAGWVSNPLYGAGRSGTAGVLFAARLDGPSADVAKGLVDAAIRAEADGLFGIAYVDARGLRAGRYKQGDDWMLAAVAALNGAGFFTRVDLEPETFDRDMPMPDAAFYFGWYRSNLCGPMARPGFRFATGAIAYHLHSGSAAHLRTADRGWTGPLLARGAAASMGAVFEPYLGGTVDIGAFVRALVAGRTFGESCYRAMPRLSWMMTCVGDPLYAPFRPDLRRSALEKLRDPKWRDVRDVVLASSPDRFDRALAACGRHPDDPLFVELAARAHFLAGRHEQAMALYRKLAGMVADDFSAVRAWRVVADYLAGRGRLQPALDACIACVRAHPKSRHALPVYRKALRLARALKAGAVEVELWKKLAANFPNKALGAFASGELWARGLRPGSAAPTVRVPRVAVAPTLDGRPDDPAWRAAGVVKRLAYSIGARDGGRRVLVRLCRDDTALFVLMEAVGGPAGPHVAGLADEAFECSLSPWRDARRAVVLRFGRQNRSAVRLRGVTWRLGLLRAGSGAGRSTVGWLVEARVPFAALGQGPEKGAVWAANFAYSCAVPKFPFRAVPSFRSWARTDRPALSAEAAGFLVFR